MNRWNPSLLATTALLAVVGLRWATKDPVSNDLASGSLPEEVHSIRPRAPEAPRASEHADTPAAVTRVSLQDWRDPETRNKPLAALLHWSAIEPAACLAWVKTLPADLAAILITEIAGGLMQSQPEEAVRFVEELPTGDTRDAMLKQAAMEYATSSLDRAVEWASGQPDAENRDLLLAAVYCVMSQCHPQQAAEQVREVIGDPEVRDRTLVEITQRWAQQDLKEAAAFVTRQEAKVAIPAAFQLTSRWPESDASSCVTWISGLPVVGRSEVLASFISRPCLHQRERLEALMSATRDPLMIGLIQKELDSF